MCYNQKCKVVSLNLAHPVYAITIRPSVCLSFCLSVTWVDQSKTLEVRIMQFSPYGSPIYLVFVG